MCPRGFSRVVRFNPSMDGKETIAWLFTRGGFSFNPSMDGKEVAISMNALDKIRQFLNA